MLPSIRSYAWEAGRISARIGAMCSLFFCKMLLFNNKIRLKIMA